MKLYVNSKCDGVHTVCIVDHSPYFGMYELNSKHYLIPSKTTKKKISNRHEAPKVYQVNGLYINSVKKFLKTNDLFKGQILPYVISYEHGFMIDREIEFKIAEFIYKLKK